MGGRRIIFENWIVDLGRDPDGIGMSGCMSGTDAERLEEIREAVAEALDSLDPEERQLVVRYHFTGQTYREISEESGKAIYRLAALHQRALRRLRRKLEPLAERLYGVQKGPAAKCPICDSESREEVDELISRRGHDETWTRIIRVLKQRYNIQVSTPQILIGHEKYH